VTAPAEGPYDAQSEVEAEAEAEARSTDRVVTFSDAVIAITITLLALDLPVPGSGLTNGQFWHELRHDWSAYLAFLVSFLVIANHWATHRQIFRYVGRLNGWVFRLNMAWLLLMIMLPFATRVVTSNGQLGARFTVYAVIQVLATGCLLFMSREVCAAHLLRADAPAKARHADLIPYLSIMFVFLVSIPVAYLAGSWAFALWALSPWVGRLLRRTGAVDRFAADDIRG
jgi:TMEM175 potassium channel family protein